MKNKRGQALVEFVIILPVLLFIIIAFIEVSSVYYEKYNLENHLDYVAKLYENHDFDGINSYVTRNHLNVTYTESEKTVKIVLSKKLKNSTFVVSNLKRISNIEAERYVYKE